jgi:hypothetical protein
MTPKEPSDLDPPFRFGALEERVAGLERGQVQVVAALDSLAREVRERSKFPWPAIWGGISVLLVLVSMMGAIVIWGFNSYLGGIQGTFDRMQAQVEKVDDSIVPRGEHQERWRALEAADTVTQREIDAIRSDLGASFTLNDTLKTLVERIERLEALRLQVSAAP